MKKKNIPFILSTVVFTVSAVALILYLYSLKIGENGYNELRNEITISSDEPDNKKKDKTEETEEGLKYYLIDETVVQEEFKDLYLKNSDTIGWIKADETTIDYPVVCTPEDEQYYLYKDFDKEYSYNGCIFAGAATDITIPSENIILYGHHILGKKMFGALDNYENEDFYKEHKYITFDTLRQTGKYEIIAVFRTKVYSDDYKGFQFYRYTNLSKEEIDENIENIKALTPYEIPTTAEYGDQLITLSTCAYHTTDGRFVVVAKRVEGKEVDIDQEPIEIINSTEE